MIMYENKNPQNFFRIYRSQYNQRVKPTFNPFYDADDPKNQPPNESAVIALLDDKKTNRLKDKDSNGFYK